MKITIRNRQKLYKLPRAVRYAIRKALYEAAWYEGISPNSEVTVTITDDDKIRFLNFTYRGLKKATDVLSFPLGEGGVYDTDPETGLSQLGDMVISFETAVRQAHDYGHSIERECGFLAVHSMLHLLGYDHERSELEAITMRFKEEAILDNIGLKR
jgi:probable rRNA maturation factor